MRRPIPPEREDLDVDAASSTLPLKRARLQPTGLSAADMLNVELRRILHHFIALASDQVLLSSISAHARARVSDAAKSASGLLVQNVREALVHLLGSESSISSDVFQSLDQQFRSPHGICDRIQKAVQDVAGRTIINCDPEQLRRNLHERISRQSRVEREALLLEFCKFPSLMNEVKQQFPGTSSTFPAQTKLPDELSFCIFDFLELSELCWSVSRVSRRWFHLVTCPEFWGRVNAFCFGPRMLSSTTCEHLPALLRKLPNLRMAKFGRRISPELMDAVLDGVLTQLPHTHTLNFSATIATKERLRALAIEQPAVCVIQNIDLSSCSRVCDEALHTIASCSSLVRLNLRQCVLVGDEGIAAIAASCPLLEDLVLRYCPMVSDQALIAISRGCRHLHNFNVKGCTRITDRGINAIALNCPLKKISMSNCINLSNEALVSLASCYELAYAHFGQCLGVSDVGLKALGTGCHLLRSVNICGCELVSESGVLALASTCPQLEHLCMKACRIEPKNIVPNLCKLCPNLQRICFDDVRRR